MISHHLGPDETVPVGIKILLLLCGDKKNGNPHLFPIFPVDYSFYSMRQLYIMHTSNQTTTKLFATPLAIMVRPLPACLVLVGVLFVTSGGEARAQRVTKTNTPGTSATLPPKAAPGKPLSGPSNPANDVQQLLISGQTAQNNGRFDEAVAIFNRVISLSSNNPQNAATANLKIGNAYMVQGKFENAAIGYQRATALNPNYAEAYNNLGEALGELKRYPQAIEAFNKAFVLDATLLKAKYNQAVTYDRMGNFRYSEFVFRNLIKSNPDYSLGYDGLAVTLSKAGRAREAISFHEKAIALSPREPSYHFNCAISYLMLKNTAKALEQQEILKEIDPAVADRLASVIVKRQM
jgi:tetratricopeptide (TPR) repeat protein